MSEAADTFQTEPGEVAWIGAYQLLGEIGRGGMGVVYKAQHRESPSPVALKTLAKFEPHSLQHFKKEFHVLADLAHPNLIRLGELVTTEREPFFTMELIHGVSFKDYVCNSFNSMPDLQGSDRNNFCFDEVRLRNALRQIIEGLNAIHNAGSLHRDLKPSNVMVNSEGRVVIVDFGLAVETDRGEFHNSLREFAGTPVFMAPEQAARKPMTASADWYSLGVMLFHALTGAFPFEADSYEKLQSQKLRGAKQSPKELVPGIPADLDSLCMDLLSPAALLRPSGEEIAKRLNPAALPVQPSTVWIGRESQLCQLYSEWEKSRTGSGRVLFVTGKSGMGKSSLVNRFFKLLIESKQKVVILRGRCYENETVTYRGFDSLVDALVQYLRRLTTEKVQRLLPIELDAVCQIFPALKDVPAIQSGRSRQRVYSDPLEVRRRGILGLRELLTRLAHWEPVVLFLDDLQWGDEDTAMIFCQLTQADSIPAALIIGTFRSEELEDNRCLSLIRRTPVPSPEHLLLAEQLELIVDRLSVDESTQLASELLDSSIATNKAVIERIVKETEGDPYFIRAFANFFAAHANNPTLETVTTETKTLSDVIWSEVSDLPNDSRRAIELISVAGRPVAWAAIQQLAQFEQDPTTALQSLRIKRIVRHLSERGNIETYHDRVRETVASRLSPAQTSDYCSRLANFFETHPGKSEPEFLGDLYRKSDQLAKAGKAYILAGKRALESLAFHRAASLFAQAIEMLNPTGREECELRVLYGNALANASRSSESAAQFLRAAELASESERPDWLQQAALRYLVSGHIDAGIKALTQALEAVQLTWPRTTLRALIGLIAREARLQIRGLRSKTTLDADEKPTPKQPAAPEKLEDTQVSLGPFGHLLTPLELRRIKICWSAAAGLSVVDPIRGSYFMTEHLRLALNSRVPRYILRGLEAYAGHVAIGGNKSRRAVRRVLVEAREVARKENHPYFRGGLLNARGIAAHLRGDWALCQRCCDRALDLLHDERCRDVAWEINTSRTFALWALQYQGNLAEVARRQPELLRIARENNDLYASLNFGTQVMTHLQLAIGKPEEARARLDEDRARLSEHGFFVQHHNHLLANAFIDLYEGKGADALGGLTGQWRKYQKSFLSRVQQVRIDYLQFYCRAALAAANGDGSKPEHLIIAKRTISKLKSEKVGYAVALAEAFHASWLHQSGESAAVKLQLEKAIVLLTKVKMQLFSTACQQILTVTFGDSSSIDQRRVQEKWVSLGVLEKHEQMAQALLPGFGTKRPRSNRPASGRDSLRLPWRVSED